MGLQATNVLQGSIVKQALQRQSFALLEHSIPEKVRLDLLSSLYCFYNNVHRGKNIHRNVDFPCAAIRE